MEFAQTSAILEFYIDVEHITTVDMLFCTSLRNFMLSKSDHPQQKKMTSCRFSRWRISAILNFRGLIMGSLKSPCTTSYRSSIESIALNCLVFEKYAFCNVATDRQTNRQTDRGTDGHARRMKPLSRAAAKNGEKK